MFSGRKFEVAITRSLSNQGLRWPGRGEASNERNLGCNRAYVDLRGLTWNDAQRLFELETSLIERIEAATDPDEEREQIEEELYEDDEGLFGLDIGVAAATVALCAAKCITCSSCNAGAYGGSHHESYPVVAFFAKPQHVEPLLKCAEEAGIGLENVDGMVIAFASDIRNMRSFAGALIRGRATFQAVTRNNRNDRSLGPSQGLL
jgi:hypothetical protein